MSRFHCPQPVLNLIVAKKKGETERQYAVRFERMQDRLGRILALRVKLGIY